MTTRIAIMQPYFLPYLGYFQLMAAVDRFILLDDVNFINRGWINRNRILLNGKPHLFSLPLQGASQNRLICEIELHSDAAWRDRFLRTLHQAYVRAPQYTAVRPLVERLLHQSARGLDEYLRYSLKEVAAFLGLACRVVDSSRVYGNAHLKGQDRILDICRQEVADRYLNAAGGVDLYDPIAFAAQGVQLSFLQSRPLSYAQGAAVDHVPWLSILDVLMFNSVPTVRGYLTQADLR